MTINAKHPPLLSKYFFQNFNLRLLLNRFSLVNITFETLIFQPTEAMKRSHIIFAALIILIILAFLFLFNTKKEANTEPKEEKVEQYQAASTSGQNLSNLELPLSASGQNPLVKKGFTLTYSETYEQPLWVAYTLTPAKLVKKVKRSDKFQPDLTVASGTATNKDYSHSGYDKGHMAPAADMSYNSDAMKESFLFSNISPQKPQFNRGIWKDLEEETRSWSKEYGELYITTGPIFTKIIERIGPDKVAVPSGYFKTILVYSRNKYWAIGFIMPNEGTDEPISHFAVPVDSVEKATGLDLYHNLPNNVEAEVESGKRLPLWLLN